MQKVNKNTGEVYSSVSDPHPDQLGRRIQIRIGNPDLDPGRQKLSPQKGKSEEISCLKSHIVPLVCRLNFCCRSLAESCTFSFLLLKGLSHEMDLAIDDMCG